MRSLDYYSDLAERTGGDIQDKFDAAWKALGELSVLLPWCTHQDTRVSFCGGSEYDITCNDCGEVISD